MAIFSLPENYPLKLSWRGKKFETTINPPSLDISLFGLNLKKEIKTHLGLDLSGGTQLVLEADMKDVPEGDRGNALESSKEIIERRVNFFGVSEPVVQTSIQGSLYRVIVELPGISNVDAAVALIGQTARLEFREWIEEKKSTDSAYLIPTIDTTKATGLTGKDLKSARLSYSTETGEPEVALEFTGDGAKKFADLTGKLIGKELPVFLDEFPLTWPTVSVAISDGRAVITGSFTRDGAKTLALQLNAGALPVPVTVIQKHTVGTTLGKISVEQSIGAGVFGLTLVALYMIIMYGRLGIIATMALVVYGLTSFVIFRLIPITLTLPGITNFAFDWNGC